MKNFRQYRFQFKRSCASGPVLGCTRLTGWLAPIPLRIQAEMRKRPGVGMYTAPPDGSRQYRYEFKRSCASGPVLGCTRLTGWLAPIPLRIQAELRKQPGVGNYAAYRMARANTATNSSGAAQAAWCWDVHGSPDGTRQYRYECLTPKPKKISADKSPRRSILWNFSCVKKS